MRYKPLLVWFGVALLVIVVAVACTMVSKQVSTSDMLPEERGIFPAGTPTPAGYAYGIVRIRNFDTTYTPYPGQVGQHDVIYWSTAVPAIANTPNWNAAKTRVAYAAGQGLSSWLSISIYEGQAASPAATDTLFFPSGVATVTYNQGAACGDDHAPDYRTGSTYRTAMATTVASFCDTFDSDSNVAGYQIDAVGYNAETRNAHLLSACPEALVNFEEIVSCDEYLSYLKWLLDLWRTECPNKVIYVGGMQGMCAGSGVDATWKASRYLMPYISPSTPVSSGGTGKNIDKAPLYIGYKWNGSVPDFSAAYCTGWGCGDWGTWQAALGRSELGGIAFELDTSGIAANDQQGHAEFAGYAAVMHGADTFWVQKNWITDFSAEALEVITSTLGTDASDSPSAWIVFRDWEFPEQVRSQSYGFSFSGIPGPFEHLASVTYATVSAEPTRYCAPSVATAVAARPTDMVGTPTPSCLAITTPSPPEFRQAWGWEANDRIGILIDDDWVVGTTFTGTLKITYLDAGTDTFTVHWTTAAGAQSSTVTKGNTNDWVTSDITLSGALLDAGQSTGGDLEIRMGTGAEIIHRVWLKWDSAVSTPVPTATWTLEPTATRTSTATFVAGTGTPTATPTPVATLITNYNYGSVTHTIWRYPEIVDRTFPWMENIIWDGNQSNTAVLLRIPAFSVPAGYTHTEVISAILYLNSTGNPSSVRLAFLEKGWNKSATWGNTGNINDPAWSTSGALGQDVDFSAYQYFYTSGAVYPVMLPVSIAVTNDVQAWHAGDDNNGWVIHAVNDPVDCADCYGITLLAGDGYPEPTRRPWLSVKYGLSIAPSATPTPTNTPTLPATATSTSAAVSTPTVTNTPVSTYTPTPTPSIPTPVGWGGGFNAPPLRLNEVCTAPLRDHDFSGDVDNGDRAVELVNWGPALDLEHYYLSFSTTVASCSGADKDDTYYIPRFTTAPKYSYKVFFQSQLTDAEGDDITIPPEGSVALCHSSGQQLDYLAYNYQGHDKCWRRSPNATGGWSQDDPTLGKSNR